MSLYLDHAEGRIFFLSDCHRMLAVRELFLNPVINDASQHLLKLFLDSAEQASVFSKEGSKRVLKNS